MQVPFGWIRWVDREADVVGITTFGASAPAKALFAHFRITTDAVVERAKARLARAEGRETAWR